MAAIFPPANQGGVPPGPNVCNGYTPTNPVVGGDGPLYMKPDCSTVLTDCQMNALVSEILGACDKLGYSYNTARIDNLGSALSEALGTGSGAVNTKVSKSGDTMTGPLTLSGDPTTNFGAATKQYVDNRDTANFNQLTTNYTNADNAVLAQIAAKVSKAGDSMSGPLVLPGAPTQPLQAATKAYVDSVAAGGGGGGGIADAPTDGKYYGRVSGTWAQVLPIAGGTLTGALILAADPAAALGAATKQYVDSKVAGGGGGGGIAEAPSDGTTYGRINATWQKVLNLSGGTLTGPLILSADPTAPMGAATKQTVDGKVAKTGDTMTGTLTTTMQSPSHILNKTAGYAATLVGQTGGANRWSLILGDTSGEAGANAGSQFQIARYADNGALIDLPLQVSRATGYWIIAGNTQIGGSSPNVPADAAVGTTISAQYAVIPYQTGRLGFNSYWGAGGTWKYQASGYAAAFYLRNDGFFCLDMANAGAAGASVSAASGSFQFTYLGNFIPSKGILAGDQIQAPSTDSGSKWAFVGAGSALISSGNYQAPLVGASPNGANTGIYAINLGGTVGVRFWTASLGALADFNTTAGLVVYNGSGYKPGGGTWGDTSDERIKTVAGDYTHGLAELEQLEPVTYTFRGNDTTEPPSSTPVGLPDETKDEPTAPYRNSPHYHAAVAGTKYVGLIAQQCESIMPELVKTRRGMIDGVEVQDFRELDTTPLIFALVNAVKDLSAQIKQISGGGSSGGQTLVQLPYSAKVTTTSAGDPGQSKIVWNTAAQADATELYLSARDVANNDDSLIWRNLQPGRSLTVQRQTDASRVMRYVVNEVTDDGGWFTVKVTPGASSGAAFGGNDALICMITSAPIP